MSYFKTVYVSALTGKRLEKVFEAVEEVYENASRRVSTGVLNDVIAQAVVSNAPPSKNGKRLKIYYATQTGINPPSFTLMKKL